MLRSTVLKFGAGAAAATATGHLVRSPRADARPSRTLTLNRSTKSTESDAPTQNEEESWLEVSLNEHGLVFGREEINQTVGEIISLCSDSESFTEGSEADDWMDTENRNNQDACLGDIFRASQRLMNHADVQSAAISAIREDDELRSMIARLSNCQLELYNETGPWIEYNDALGVPPTNARREASVCPLKTMIEDLSYHFGRLILRLKNVGGKTAGMVRNAVGWLLGMLGDAVRAIGNTAKKIDPHFLDSTTFGVKVLYNFGPLGKGAPIVLAGAMIITIVLIMKRST